MESGRGLEGMDGLVELQTLIVAEVDGFFGGPCVFLFALRNK